MTREEKIIKVLIEFIEDLLSLMKHSGNLQSEIGDGVRVISVIDRWEEIKEQYNDTEDEAVDA